MDDAPLSFDRYLAAVRAADPADHPAVPAAEFERMRAYLLGLYDGVRPVGTHRDPSGVVIDCVPFDQFPTVRAAHAAGHEVAHAAPAPRGFAAARTGPRPGSAVPSPSACPAGTVAMARLTLDELTRAGSLDRFLAPPAKYHEG